MHFVSILICLLVSTALVSNCGKKQHKPDEIFGAEENPIPSDESLASEAKTMSGRDPLKTCRLALDCKAPLPDLGAIRPFKSTYSSAIARAGSPLHRGRDVFVKEGEKAWVLAKFSYGILDSDLKGEEIDLYLSRACQSPWEKLGTVTTTADAQNSAVEGIVDSGGRVYFQIPEILKVGRYRVLLAVSGDHSTTELFVEVLPKESKVVVTDVDGTLTSSELAAVTSVVGLPDPEAHPGAADMLRAFHQRGYFIYYLTARPEWMMQMTRVWVNARGFPPGVINTTQSKAGASNDAAASFKTEELKLLKSKTGIIPSYAFGNKASDVTAFDAAGIDQKHSYFHELPGNIGQGVNHNNYQNLVKTALEAPLACP